MTYYRVAWRDHQTTPWRWKTTILTSLQAVLQLLKSYSALPQDRLLVFTAVSQEELNQMLDRENYNLVSGSVTAAQFLQARKLQVPGPSPIPSGTAKPAIVPVTAHPSRYAQSTSPDLAVSGTMNRLERRRQEIESGPGGDHDLPYCFTLPLSIPQRLAWLRLQARVQASELQS